MTVFIIVMLLSLALPLMHSFRSQDLWERMLCYTSLSTRAAVILILYSKTSQDPMIAVVAVVMLSVGNSGLLLLANLFQAMESECD